MHLVETPHDRRARLVRKAGEILFYVGLAFITGLVAGGVVAAAFVVAESVR